MAETDTSKGMGVTIADLDGVRDRLLHKLQGGWMTLHGNEIGLIENAIYTPGSGKNSGFEVWVIPGRGPKLMGIICIGKKHPYWDNHIPVSDLDEAIGLEIGTTTNTGTQTGALIRLVCTRKPEEIPAAIDKYLHQLEVECGVDLGTGLYHE